MSRELLSHQLSDSLEPPHVRTLMVIVQPTDSHPSSKWSDLNLGLADRHVSNTLDQQYHNNGVVMTLLHLGDHKAQMSRKESPQGRGWGVSHLQRRGCGRHTCLWPSCPWQPAPEPPCLAHPQPPESSAASCHVMHSTKNQ